MGVAYLVVVELWRLPRTVIDRLVHILAQN